MDYTPPQNLIVFDWGGTLMHTFSEYQGAMVDWPQVQAIQGVHQALEALKLHNTLVVGSNAVDSNADQLLAALERVSLRTFIDRAFTFHELSVKKPNRGFFEAIMDEMHAAYHLVIMVGDDWMADCLGAHNAGWKTIWYNPNNQISPGLLPLHDGEVSSMDRLPVLLQKPFWPSFEECISWLLQSSATHNLLMHVQMVAAIGYQMALWLRAEGYSVDPIMVHRAGLLHDIAKIEMRRIGEEKISHSEAGALRLEALGQPLLAEIARHHQLDTILHKESRPQTIEQILVYFADKLSNGNRLVTPEERLAALARHYPDSSSMIQQALPLVLDMQEQLCQMMKIPSGGLVDKVKQSLIGKGER